MVFHISYAGEKPVPVPDAQKLQKVELQKPLSRPKCFVLYPNTAILFEIQGAGRLMESSHYIFFLGSEMPFEGPLAG